MKITPEMILEEEYNECDRCYDKHAKSKGYIKREDMELDVEKVAEIIWDTIQVAIQKSGQVVQKDMLEELLMDMSIDSISAKAIAEAKPFKEKEG